MPDVYQKWSDVRSYVSIYVIDESLTHDERSSVYSISRSKHKIRYRKIYGCSFYHFVDFDGSQFWLTNDVMYSQPTDIYFISVKVLCLINKTIEKKTKKGKQQYERGEYRGRRQVLTSISIL